MLSAHYYFTFHTAFWSQRSASVVSCNGFRTKTITKNSSFRKQEAWEQRIHRLFVDAFLHVFGEVFVSWRIFQLGHAHQWVLRLSNSHHCADWFLHNSYQHLILHEVMHESTFYVLFFMSSHLGGYMIPFIVCVYCVCVDEMDPFVCMWLRMHTCALL